MAETTARSPEGVACDCGTAAAHLQRLSPEAVAHVLEEAAEMIRALAAPPAPAPAGKAVEAMNDRVRRTAQFLADEGWHAQAIRLEEAWTALRAALPATPVPKVMVCGVDCRPGDTHCNGYCAGKANEPPAWKPTTAPEVPGAADARAREEVAIGALLSIRALHVPPGQTFNGRTEERWWRELEMARAARRAAGEVGRA